MTESQAPPQKRRWLRKLVTAVLILALYLLSIGPAAWVTQKVGGSDSFLGRLGDVFYAPLGLAARLTTTEDWVVNYVEWWLQ